MSVLQGTEFCLWVGSENREGPVFGSIYPPLQENVIWLKICRVEIYRVQTFVTIGKGGNTSYLTEEDCKSQYTRS